MMLILIGMMFLGLIMRAQNESPEPEAMGTVFGKSGETTIGWTIGVESGYTQFDKRDVWTGAWIWSTPPAI